MILTSFDTTSKIHWYCGPWQPCLQIWWPQISNRNQSRQIFFNSKCLDLLRHQLVKEKFGNMCIGSIFYITLCTKIFERYTYFSSEMALLYLWKSGRHILKYFACYDPSLPIYSLSFCLFLTTGINTRAVSDLVLRTAWVEVIHFFFL